MLKQIKLREASGRTIKSVHHDGDSICFIFDDGTFALVRQDTYNYNDIVDEIVSLDPQKFDVWWPAKLIELGVLTKEEYADAKAANERIKAERQLKHKQEQFLKLQKELYGDDPILKHVTP